MSSQFSQVLSGLPAITADTDTDLATCSDEELARQARAGSIACFDKLARRLQVPMLSFLRQRFGQSQAEEILQEALLKAWQQLGKYEGKRSFRAWAFTIAYRVGASHHRGRVNQNSRQITAEITDPGEGPLKQLERAEQRESLWAGARRLLSEDQFAAVWLYYVEAMPAGEVAKVMGRSWVSVKTMLHRARLKLMEMDHE